jgi:hypothetical protein
MGYDKSTGHSNTFVATFLHMLDQNKNVVKKDKTLMFEFMNIYNSNLLENEKMQHYFRALRNRGLVEQSICLNIMARLQS